MSEQSQSNLPWPIRLISFAGFYLKEVVMSNMLVAWDVLTPRDRMKPVFIGIDVSYLTSRQRFILANLITMTPGTLTIDYHPDSERLFVHAMYADNPEEFRSYLQDKYVRKVCNVF